MARLSSVRGKEFVAFSKRLRDVEPVPEVLCFSSQEDRLVLLSSGGLFL
ncbi:hypothetical protein [Candidatus Methylacidithermus pantelleriae]|nr:hypothetical protein [Candidatus Methylacidithermus pantelleriae]